MSSSSAPSEQALQPLTLSASALWNLVHQSSPQAESRGIKSQDSQWMLLKRSSSDLGDVQVCWDTRSVPHNRPCVLFVNTSGSFDPWPELKRLAESPRDTALFLGFVVDDAAVNQAKPTTLTPNLQRHILAVSDSAELLRIVADQCLLPATRDILTIAVTGTNGKTSTTALMAQLLSEATGTRVARLGTLGFFDGLELFEQPFPTTPDFGTFCVFLNHLVRIGTRTLVMEASSHGLAQKRLHHWQFDGVALTNLTPDHLDFHKTMDDYWAAKRLLFSRHLKPGGFALVATQKSPWQDLVSLLGQGKHPTALVCPQEPSTETEAADTEPLVQRVSKVTKPYRSFEILTYTAHQDVNTGLALTLRPVSKDSLPGQQASKAPTGSTDAAVAFESPLLFGHFQAENLALALAMMMTLGHDPKTLASLAPRLRPVPGRMEVVTPIAARNELPLVFVDYAHSPDALESSLRSVRAMLPDSGVGPRSRVFTVFGCGGDRDKTKRPTMGSLATHLSDFTVVTSDNPRNEAPEAIIRDIAAGIAPDASWVAEPDRARAIAHAIALAGPRDIVIIAGKGHEDYQIIGSSKLPFSDVEIARKVLDSRLLTQRKRNAP